MTKLNIDEEFKNLIRPLFRAEYLQLEANILADGCRNPITVWNGTIIDGHNRYEICMRHNIPFATEELHFNCREEAIAWICANQLGRRNLTEETRKFLIGKQYESEKKLATQRNAFGINQYTANRKKNSPVINENADSVSSSTKRWTAQKIAEENHISHGTVEKYAQYSRALDEISQKEPNLLPKILSGKYKISHNGVLELAGRSKAEIRKVNKRLDAINKPYVQYHATRKEIQRTSQTKSTFDASSVKDMPAYDPDAEVTSLAITIPSWISSIQRTSSQANLKQVSSKARENLLSSLKKLQKAAVDMIIKIKEDDHD